MRLSNLAKAQAAVVIAVLIFMGCASTSGRQSTGQVVDDSAITAKVKSSFLADPVVSATAISVTTTDGAVSLDGFVKSEQERLRAIQLAQSTQGVRVVDARNLVVRR
jgi:hyperosmotically inducible periplasmic protein